MPETDNSRVRQVMVMVGTLLPRHFSNRNCRARHSLVGRSFVRVHLTTAFPDLIAHLAREGEFSTAIALGNVFFGVEEESPQGKRRQGLDPWHVDHHLKRCISALREADALATLEFLRDRLCVASKEPSPRGEDYSYIWRRTIAESNYQVGEVKDVFVNWVRDVALSLARDPWVGPAKVYKVLLGKERPILTRITMYIAAERLPTVPILL